MVFRVRCALREFHLRGEGKQPQRTVARCPATRPPSVFQRGQGGSDRLGLVDLRGAPDQIPRPRRPAAGRVKRRQRGGSDRRNLLALILSCCGGGHLSDVDALAADSTACRLADLQAVPDSCRLGEFLAHMSDKSLTGLLECMRLVSFPT